MAVDSERLEELVLFIAHEAKDLPNFGRVKLAKVLFYSDFTAYREAGVSLTGETYLRFPKGPFPSDLSDVERRLASQGRVRLAYDVDEYEEKRIVPLEPSRADQLFERWQLDFVRRTLADIASTSASAISDRSHDHAGWIITEPNGEIPYGTSFLPDEKPPATDAEKARRVARDRGWLTRDGWVWER